MSRTSPAVSSAARVPMSSVPLSLPSSLYCFPDFASAASNLTIPVVGLNDALLKSIGTGVRNLPVRFPAAWRRSSTVTASGTPPFGVQLPDHVPLIAARSAADAVASSKTDIEKTNNAAFMTPPNEFRLRESLANRAMRLAANHRTVRRRLQKSEFASVWLFPTSEA